jgi:RNA polymerase sigma-70 factor (ECF subfamily)
MDRSDEALIVAHRQGDSTAFGELVRRHADSLFGYLMRMTDNREQAEDHFQETFRRVHQRAGTFESRGRFEAWLFSIASKVAMDDLRKRSRRPKMVSVNLSENWNHTGGNSPHCGSPIAGEDCTNPSQAAILAEQRAQVRQALGGLPPRQRATVILAYYEGLAYREVADVLGCSVGTVKAQMFRALRKLAYLLSGVQEGRT